MKYFNQLVTVEEIKAHYRRLAMSNHPDKGGDLRVMQEINDEYVAALKRCDGRTSTGSDGKEHTYRYDEKVEGEVISKIDELLKARLADVHIDLIGTWIWVTGNTKPVKDALKGMGCKWHSVRECWFWNAQPWRGGRSKSSLGALAAKYGCTRFENERAREIA